MAKFTTTQTWADGDQVTSSKLAAIITGLSADADLASDSTITITSGAIKVGVIAAGNIGSSAVTTIKLADSAVTAAKLADDAVTTDKILAANVTAAKLASDTATWAKTPSADRAVQADMQSETASHFVSPDVMKYHPGVAKAYGKVALENGVTTITGGFNVTSATDTGSGREITMAVTMANVNYIVVAMASSGGTPVTVSGKTTTKFTLDASAELAGRTLEFVVFGQLA